MHVCVCVYTSRRPWASNNLLSLLSHNSGACANSWYSIYLLIHIFRYVRACKVYIICAQNTLPQSVMILLKQYTANKHHIVDRQHNLCWLHYCKIWRSNIFCCKLMWHRIYHKISKLVSMWRSSIVIISCHVDLFLFNLVKKQESNFNLISLAARNFTD